MSELRTHAPGPWWVEELPRSDVTPDRIPLHGRHGIVLHTSRRGRATSSINPLRCLAHQRQHANAPFTGGRTVRVFHRCVAH